MSRKSQSVAEMLLTVSVLSPSVTLPPTSPDKGPMVMVLPR